MLDNYKPDPIQDFSQAPFPDPTQIPVGYHTHNGLDSPKLDGYAARPAGTDGSVQYNDDGLLGGDENFKWDKDDSVLTLDDASEATIKTPDSEVVNLAIRTGDGVGTATADLILAVGETDSGGGGDLYIQAGNTDSGGAGEVFIDGGDSGDGGGGDITLSSGSASTGGGAGSILLRGGASDSGSAGDLTLLGGFASSSGSAGDIRIRAGASTSGTDGRIEFTEDGLGAIRQMYYGRITTTNATVTTLRSIALGSSATAIYAEARITGRRTGGIAGTANDMATYHISTTIKGTGSSTYSLPAATTTIHSYEDQAGWACDFAISSSDFLVQVTGAANNNITWSGEVALFQLSP